MQPFLVTAAIAASLWFAWRLIILSLVLHRVSLGQWPERGQSVRVIKSEHLFDIRAALEAKSWKRRAR